MAFDRTRTLRGALAGAAAGAVWIAQQPLDKRVFGVDYDDAFLLGRLARLNGPAANAGGAAIHVANAAVFGALYANVAPSLPLPRALRGPAVALAEHLATWPLTMVVDRLDLGVPRLWGNGPAFAQAAYRHVLFGLLLGEIERRVNPPEAELEPVDAEVVATNGHGSPEHLVATGP
jgi:hypothetical protein